MYKDPTEDEKTGQAWQICKALADQTNQVWRAERVEQWPTRRIVHLDGYGVVLSWDTAWNGKPGRIHVRGVWPTSQDGKEHYPYRDAPSITVASDRDPKAIAREIINRFLPSYRTIYEKQAKIAAETDAHQDATSRNIGRLSAEISGRYSERDRDLRREAVTFWPTGSCVHTVCVQGESIRFEAFSVPIDLAIQILRLAEERKD